MKHEQKVWNKELFSKKIKSKARKPASFSCSGDTTWWHMSSTCVSFCYQTLFSKPGIYCHKAIHAQFCFSISSTLGSIHTCSAQQSLYPPISLHSPDWHDLLMILWHGEAHGAYKVERVQCDIFSDQTLHTVAPFGFWIISWTEKNGQLKNGIAWNLACEIFRCNLVRLVAIHLLCVRNIHEDMSGKICSDRV